MGSLQVGVVVEHGGLVVPEGPPQLAPVVGQRGDGQKRREVDAKGDGDEKQAAPGAQLQTLAGQGAHILPAAAGLPQREGQLAEEQPGQAQGAIGGRPLGGDAQAGEHPAHQQGGQQPLPAVPAHVPLEEHHHGVVHQQQEEHCVGVDGGDARLGEVHKVKGEQHRARKGQARPAKELLEQVVQHRQHQHPEQRPHKPPAKGVHPKEADAQGNDELAQGGVGVLVGLQAQDVLVGGAGVVDFVEVGGVFIGGLQGHHVLLVGEQLRPRPLAGDGGHHRRVRVFQPRLVEGDAAV